MLVSTGDQNEDHRFLIKVASAEKGAEVSISEVRRELARETHVDENTSFDSL